MGRSYTGIPGKVFHFVIGSLVFTALHCDHATDKEVHSQDTRAAPSVATNTQSNGADNSSEPVCQGILDGLRAGTIPPQLQRVFSFDAAAVRFTANRKIEWFIADPAPGELPLNTVYGEGEVAFDPLRLRARTSEPMAPVVLVTCSLMILTPGPPNRSQLDVSFTVRRATPEGGTETLDFSGAISNSLQERHCNQFFPRTGEIRDCRPLESGELD